MVSELTGGPVGTSSRPVVVAYVALGGNLGDAVATVRQAMQRIGGFPDTELVQQSALYGSAPIDSSGPEFVNAVVEVSTGLSAPDLLVQLQGLELLAGRERPYRNAPRTLDLDILLFGNGRIQSPALTVPHPRMWERAFVLVPLAEIAPGQVTPEMLQAVSGQAIRKLTVPGARPGE